MKKYSYLASLMLLCTMCSAGSEWQDIIDADNNNSHTGNNNNNNSGNDSDDDSDENDSSVTYEIKIGIITDAHYSTKAASSERHYSASKQKISEAVQEFNNAGVDMAISLGDLVDNEYTHYPDIQVDLEKLAMPSYKILGNHDFVTPYSEEQQAEALKVLGITNRYFSIVSNGLRLIFLDSSDLATYSHPLESIGYREAEAILKELKDDLSPNAKVYNGAIGSVQMKWLESELQEAQSLSQHVVCFTHIPLALPATGSKYTLWNDEDVRDLLCEYPCVKAVIGGHHHEGGYLLKENIHHITLKGMVQGEQNSYSIISIKENCIEIDGYGRETDRVYIFN